MKKLSPRQRQIAELVSEGCSSKEIAYRLQISYHAVKITLSRIYERAKLNEVGNPRVNLAVWWLREGKHQ